LQAYEAAGAEVLYAPGITAPEEIRTVCGAVAKPVNVLMGPKGGPRLSVKELGELGARRISVGSGFSRAAMTAFILAAREVIDEGTFDRCVDAMSTSELVDLLKQA
jgi:2-methylisocitrate lyase-like PEP mutase family enzyme